MVKKCTKIHNACARPLFFSLNPNLFCDVHIAVAAVASFKNSLTFQLGLKRVGALFPLTKMQMARPPKYFSAVKKQFQDPLILQVLIVHSHSH